MKLLYKYLLFYFLKIFLIINFVIFVITAVYGLADLFLSLQSPPAWVGFKYILLLIPFVFYYLSPLSYTSAGLVVLKRLMDKKVDLTAQSFGISPYNLILPLIISVVVLSIFHIAMNEKIYPTVYKEIKNIEERYKGRKKVLKKIARDIWFLKRIGEDKVYVFVKTIEIDTGKFFDLIMIRVGIDDRVKEITEGKYGVWKGTLLKVGEGFRYNFLISERNEKLQDKNIDIGFSLREISLISERIEFLPSSSLIFLFSKGKDIGIDINQYLGEIMYRLGVSLFPFFVFVPVISTLLLTRNIKKSMLTFFIFVTGGWFFITLSKILPSEAKTSPLYVIIPYTVLLLYSLKRLYDLRKGIRV